VKSERRANARLPKSFDRMDTESVRTVLASYATLT
jgi:hypothetical protein